MESIKLNDILRLNNLNNVKIRFNVIIDGNKNPIELFKNGEILEMLNRHYWNSNRNKSFREGQITVGLVKIKQNEDFWLLFHIGQVTKDLNILNGVGYEYQDLTDYQKYVGRLIVKYKNTTQALVRNAEAVIDDCYVSQILPDTFDNDLFPGYDKINISWIEMNRVLDKENWKTALQNQKGVYLITDISNGKKYVGSAYGTEMILGRWRDYIKTGHGGNIKLRELTFDYIKQNFRYTILEIYKSTTADEVIINRESWWKEILQSKRHGYNEN